jgi:hypothetical protein
MAIEYTISHLSRSHLQEIIAAAIYNRPDVDEVLVRCHSAATTVWPAVKKMNTEGIYRNSLGKKIRITIAVNRETSECL